MKELLTLCTIVLLSFCVQAQKKESKKVNYIYEATYLDDFKMGNPDLVLKVQEMHKHIISKNYKMAGNYLANDVVFTVFNPVNNTLAFVFFFRLERHKISNR